MATDIIPLITPYVDRLCNIVIGQLQYVTKYEEYYSQLEKGMVKLQTKKEDVGTKLEKAKRELKKLRKEVLVWLDRFEIVENEWKTLMEKRDTSSRCMNGFLPNPLSRRKMSKQIVKKMIPDVNDLYQDGDFTEVADDPQPPDVVPQVASGSVNIIESRKRIMNDMMGYLKDDNIRSIGVHGMGGIGKTTLVKNINDELRVQSHFKKVIMATVSKDPDVEKIQVIIAERLGLELKEIDLATRANKLYERLKMEGSILIILDDMWNMMELGELGLRPGTQDMNCKFIITTRNVDICKQMKVQKRVEMSLLSETESWALFEEKVGPAFKLSKFQSIAEEIVKKCKGSPLAISTLGSTLGGEENDYVWKHALRVLKNPSAMGLKGIMPEVVTSLTWSYEYLSNNPDAQLCFLYCCFFKEDHNISLIDLRNYGIAEKFVKETRALETASDELLRHVKILKDCGLLLDGDEDETVKMHDVVRDVAIFIADRDQEGLVINVDGGSGYLPQSEKLETCKRISLIYNEEKVLSHSLECRQLKSLMVAGTDNLTVEYDNLFKEATTLSALDIRARTWYCGYIPESISCLKNVQTLYLHKCDIFQKVAILGGLIKLEVLSMREYRIGELLPEEIGNLTNLRYLDLTGSNIEYVAPNVFSKLTRIEELYMGDGFSQWGQCTKDGTKTNAGFKEVATLPLLSILEVETWEAEGSEGNPDWLKNVKQFRIFVNREYGEFGIDNSVTIKIKKENMQKHLWVGKLIENAKESSFLCLWACHGFKSVTELGADGGFKCLARLVIVGGNDLQKVMVANEPQDLFWSLRELCLISLRNLEKIFDGVTWSVKFLEKLTSIEIEKCPRLSIIFPCNILFPEKRLENLQTVQVEHCDEVQHVFSTEDDETAIGERPEIECTDTTPARTSLLSGITDIFLSNLPKLKSIWTGVVPSGSLQGLKELKIVCCPKLKFLFSFGVARHLNQLHTLSIVRCPGLREIIGNGEEEIEHNSLLPALQNLQLKQLWRLSSFFKGDLPITCPLKEIKVKFCPNLTRFPLKSVSSLTSFDAEGWWFRRLDENQASVFQRFVKQDEPEFDTGHLVAAALWSDDSVSRHEGMTQIWKILSEPELPLEVRQAIVSAVVHRSIELLDSEDFPQLQSEAAWMFANVAPSGYPLDVVFANLAPSGYPFDVAFANLAPDRRNVNIHMNWVVPVLVKLRDSPHEDVRENVALALGKIRYQNDDEETEEDDDNLQNIFFDEEDVYSNGDNVDAIHHWVVPIIVKLLSSHQEVIRAQAVLALGNMGGASAKRLDLVLGYGGLTALLAQLNGDIEISIIRNTTWALCRFFHLQPYLPFEQMKLALPALKSLIHSNDETVCSNACEAISVIAADTTVGIQAVIEADVCGRLVELLQHPSPSVVIAALETIKNIALGDDMQIQCIIDYQVLPCLLNLLTHDHTERIKVAACWTIANIMRNSVQHIQAVIAANIIGPLVHQLENDGDQMEPAITAIRNATRFPTEEVIKHLVDKGCLKALCDQLDYSDSDIVETCLEGLRNILQVRETSDGVVNRYVQLAHDSGGLKKIVDLLCDSDTRIQELAIGRIVIFARISPECKDLVLTLGALIPLLSNLNENAKVSILSSSLEALLNFFIFRPYPSFEQMKPALPDLQRLIHSNDETVCSKACLVLGGLCICTFDDIKDFFDPSIFSRLLELLEHPSPSVVWAAVIAIVSIARCGKVQSQCFIDHRALPILLSLLTRDHEECIKRAACAAITNIMSAGEEQVQAVIDASNIGPLVQQLESFESCKEYVPGAIFNATSTGNWEHIDYIANQDCIKLLCNLLDSLDSIIVAHCLNVLANILSAGETGGIRDQGGVNSYAHLIAESGGLKKIVNLQHHNNTDIQEKAANIVKAYHLEDTYPPSDPPVAGSPKGLVEELEGGEGNKLGHAKAETQVEALVGGSPVTSGIATSSSPIHGDIPLIEEFERVKGNKLGHDNTDDASPTDSFGLGKNEFPILPERSDLATSSSFFSKPMQKRDLNSTVGKNDQSEGSASGTKQEPTRAPTITDTMKILDAMDIKIGDPTYFRAIELFQEEGWREAFMCMSDTRRKGWLLSIEARKI